MKLQTRFTRVLIPLLLVCLLGACGAPAPENWTPVRNRAPEPSELTEIEGPGESSETSTEPETESTGSTAFEASTESVPRTEGPTAPRSTEPAPVIPTDEESASPASEPTAEAPESESPPDRGQPIGSEAAEEAPQITYVANTNSKKFHIPSCSSVSDMKESNKWYFTGTREELIRQGYEPCKRCKP